MPTPTCAVCGQPAANVCPKCGRPLCVNCTDIVHGEKCPCERDD